MNNLTQVQKGIEYIEDNLDFDISLKQVALIACMSQWHFQRIFKALTNETLKTYIRSRRLANSLNKLLTSNERIIDIAVTAGYESQESFTRAFKQVFEMTPNEYRKLGDKSLFMKKIQFNRSYIRHINKNISLEPEIIIQKTMKLIGMKTNFYSIASEKNNIAETLPPLWNKFLSRLNEIDFIVPNMCYGIVQQTSEKSESLEYFAVAEVTKISDIPKGMESIELPETQYAKFTHKGLVKDLDNSVNYIYSSWLLKSDFTHTYAADLEFYGDKFDQLSTQSEMHYAIPIK